jgi:uncharacterized caspase-like protein
MKKMYSHKILKTPATLLFFLLLLCSTNAFTQGAKTQVYAVIVGINNYNSCDPSGSSNLRYCVKDAQSFHSLLLSTGVPAANMQVLTDDGATAANIKAAMRRLFSKAGSNDRVIFYFSGHGDNGNFITGNCRSSLKHSEVKNEFKASRAGSKYCFADACYSGGIKAMGAAGTPLAQPTEDEVQERHKNLQAQGPNVVVFISSRAHETSIEHGLLGNGIFTYFLLKGLKGEADANADKIITILELFQYVSNGVKRHTNYEQNPVMFGSFKHHQPVLRLK